MVLDEASVYLATKAFLQQNGWTLLAGQPPGGCDHLPVVEIKAREHTGIGSKGSYKPDLVAAGHGTILIVEAKPKENASDAEKLRLILRSTDKLLALYEELNQRRLFLRRGLTVGPDEFVRSTYGALAYCGVPRQLTDLAVICVSPDPALVVMCRPRNDSLGRSSAWPTGG